MFHWTISLSDKQVLMLVAFFNATDDKNGSRFDSVNAMIGDAWDVRAVRKLQEDGLLSVQEYFNEETGFTTNRWNITKKGELISLAIREDSESLSRIGLKNGRAADRLITADGNRRSDNKQVRKRVCGLCKKSIMNRHKYTKADDGTFLHIDCNNPRKV